ncbi:hypothetical protein DIPPA_60183 [Diplonema papillatum]|nr:hypothetical protein DIPPA_60183 [Diplonema papillatum]
MVWLALFALVALIAPCTADTTFERSVGSISPNTTFWLSMTPGCGASDQYGSRNCTFPWGTGIYLDLSANFSTVIADSAFVMFSFALADGTLYQQSCQLCGPPCNLQFDGIPVAILTDNCTDHVSVKTLLALPLQAPFSQTVLYTVTFNIYSKTLENLLTLRLSGTSTP